MFLCLSQCVDACETQLCRFGRIEKTFLAKDFHFGFVSLWTGAVLGDSFCFYTHFLPHASIKVSDALHSLFTGILVCPETYSFMECGGI